MKRSDVRKVQLSITSIILLIVIVCLINIPVVEFKDRGLGNEIQQVLDDFEPNTYAVGEPIFLTSSLEALGNFYALSTNSSNASNKQYVSIIRIMGISGPFPAVFIYDTANGARFFGIAGLRNLSNNQVHGITEMQSAYWEEVIEKAFEESFANGGAL